MLRRGARRVKGTVPPSRVFRPHSIGPIVGETTMVRILLFAALVAAPAAAAAQQQPPPVPPLVQQAEQPPAGQPPTVEQAPDQILSIARAELRRSALALKKAGDIGGEAGRQQAAAAQQEADEALKRVDLALTELQGNPVTDEAMQAIRNALIELQSAQEDVRTLEAESPDAAVQALEDLERATSEVQDNIQLAEQPDR